MPRDSKSRIGSWYFLVLPFNFIQAKGEVHFGIESEV